MANGHGGKRAGAGRKPGAVIQRTREIANAAIKNGLTPLDYMLQVLRDPAADLERRDKMAIAAAPYLHPRLASIDHNSMANPQKGGKVNLNVTFVSPRHESPPMIDITPPRIAAEGE